MKTQEVADRMGVSVALVRHMANQGKLPFCIVKENKTNKTYYFDRERFELWKKGEL